MGAEMSVTEKPNFQQSVGDGVAVQIDHIAADLLEQLGQAREQLDRAEDILIKQTNEAKRLIAGVVDASRQVIAATHHFAKTVQSLAANNARPLIIETPQTEDRRDHE